MLNTARGLARFRSNTLLCTSSLLSPTTHSTVSTPGMPCTHDKVLCLSTSLPAQIVIRQEEVFKEFPLQLLVISTPEKFVLWAAKCVDANMMVGWGPEHLMPARKMRPSTPRRYRLHSAACAPDAPAAVADGSKVTPRGCTVDLATSKQERKASQPAATQALVRLQRTCKIGTTAASAGRRANFSGFQSGKLLWGRTYSTS